MATSHTAIGAVKKESTNTPLVPSRLTNTTPNEVPRYGRHPPMAGSSSTEAIWSSSS
ncbi:hypothetical protein EDD18DRAFT_1344282 [Armillaria luteobubalina]|uniref:Uncharacterized protein n=1 Tax=Armillaria luteobubalina TaxID=153913 RepID=A0AA39QP26_9AGAR|nr:hypothetical protein EDD18DRAFT_1344282 [Armillaria luteobubalina]